MKANIDIFKKWMHYQIISTALWQYEEYDNKIVITYHDCKAEIHVYGDIIEESIKKNEENIFYLFYSFNDYAYGKKMFNVFIEYLSHQKQKKTHKILLSCSGGMTTSFFKTRMMEYLSLRHLHYEIDAAAVEDIDYIADQYDLILIAPQVRYSLSHIKQIAPQCHVEPIDPTVFASYNCTKLYEQIAAFYKMK